MVLAEKIVTAIERGENNTRWRDFTDILSLAETRSIRGAELQSAIHAVAHHRHVTVEPLEPLIGNMPEAAQRKWEIWRRKQRLEGNTPVSFAELLAACISFADPILTGIAAPQDWHPDQGHWY